MGSPRHSDALRAEIYASFADGMSGSILAQRYGMSRCAILGICKRHRDATGAPPISPHRQGLAKTKEPRVPRRSIPRRPRDPSPPPFSGGASSRPGVLSAGFRDMAFRPGLRCDAETLSGPCGREACLDGRCLGHRYLSMRSDERLRPPPARIASEMSMRHDVERLVPTRVDWRGYVCYDAVGDLTPSQVSQSLSHTRSIDRLASHFGWRRIDEYTYVQRRAA